MINTLKGDEFERSPFGKHHSLNLHKHESNKPDTVIVFVHGLNGSGYGTWKSWPKIVFDNKDNPCDVAIYYYPSLFRALPKLQRGADISVQAEQLASHLKDLSRNYQNIYIIAHSLGGLVAEEAVTIYLQSSLLSKEQQSAVTPISAIFLMASPRSGSGKALRAFSFLFRDVNRLRLLSREHARISGFFESHVQVQAVASSGNYRFLLPRYAGLATLDVAVSPTSASGGIPEGQRHRFTGTHFSVVKPDDMNSPQHQWLMEKIGEVREVRRQWNRNEKRKEMSTVHIGDSQPFVVTSLRGEFRRSEWDIIYNEVRSSSSTPYADVIDHQSLESETKIDLLITVGDSTNIIRADETAKAAIDAAVNDFESHKVRTAGICPIGPQFTEAEGQVRKWLTGSTASSEFYVEGVEDTEILRALLARWIDAVMHRNPHRQLRQHQRYNPTALSNFDDYEVTD
ncbi:putative lipase [Streptomyces sp. NBC_01696]|uniref:esterase/lipase family protein n=1 Tax=unclassified Streptomyces TaxID=2593676 RepID=UPI002E301E0E|nr:alpha/beta hydrolase [Streptomyces sp. NBC_01696]